MERFKNKNIMITGAASGIGKAVAYRIAKEQGNLILLDINAESLKTLANELKQYNHKALIAQCDVANFSETQDVITKLSDELGGINALSHNAGIMHCYNTHSMTIEEWNQIISINLTGTFNVNRAALPYLLKNTNSYLVNTASIAVEQAHPWLSAYSASKGGIVSFTRSIALEYALQGLHANCVLPGGVETELAAKFSFPDGVNKDLVKMLSPLGNHKPAKTDSIANVIALLCSDEANHINGTEVRIDGGKI